MMRTRLWLRAAVVAFALTYLAVTVLSARADTTVYAPSTTPIDAADWTNLGAGPLLLENPGPVSVYVAAAASKPAASAIGHPLKAGDRLSLAASSTIWARAAQGTGVLVTSALDGATVKTLSSITNAVPVYANTATATNGGLFSVARLLTAAASTNATLVKNAGGRLYKIFGYNAAASVRYLKLYNKATAPTVGTDTPVATFALAPSQAFAIDFLPVGFTFTIGIGFALTTGGADADTAALTANDVLALNAFYL